MENNLFSDCALMLGFTANGNPKESANEKNLSREINIIFSSYKNMLLERANNFILPIPEKIKNEFKYLYEPLDYHLSSYFTKVYIALVDDFVFPARHFRPFNTLNEKHNKQSWINSNVPNISFLYQTQIGIHVGDNSTDTKLVTKFAGLHLKPTKFISITNFKLNTGILTGLGTTFSRDIYNKIKELCDNDASINKSILLCSFGWNEFTLLLFSDDSTSFTRIIKNIRNWKFSDLKQAESTSKNIIENSLIYSLTRGSNKKINVNDAHLIMNSYSYFGFKNLSNLKSIPLSILFKVVIHIKPGHSKKSSI